MNLYKISNEYQSAFDKLSEMDLDDDTISDSLALIRDDFETKAIACIKHEKGLNGQIDTISSEIKRLSGLKSSLKAKQDRFREYIRSNMEETGIDKISCDLFSITLKKAAKVVGVFDLELVPDEFMKKLDPVVDKAGIKKSLQNGNFVDGAVLKDGKRALLIR